MSSASATRRKRLSECLREDVADVSIAADRDVWITGIATDSRRVRAGDLFIATRGAAHDGHDFVDAAVTKGAVAVLAERDVADARSRSESARYAARGWPNRSAILRPSESHARLYRRDRHQRQNIRYAIRRNAAFRGRQTRGIRRYARLELRRETLPGRSHDRRRSNRSATSRRPCFGRRRMGRDGNEFACTRSGPRCRCGLRRGCVYEPDARPPRLSRNDGAIRGREASPVRMADAARRRRQLGRPARPHHLP